MRKVLFGAAALIALAQPAMSADLRLPVKAPPPVAEAWSWTGCFAGGHIGGLWDNEKWINLTPGGDFFGESLGEHTVSGLIGGGQAGCDYQFAGPFVIGVQGDVGFTDASGANASVHETGVAYHSRVENLASVTGRFGYGFDRFLGYVRGGAAWERDNYWATQTMLGLPYTARDTRSGWTIGVGGEYAFTNFLSAFVEYNYYNFGSSQIPLTPLVPGLRPGLVDIRENAGVVRAGVNLRFGG
jgi:outer membrane immunogenic protein